MCWCRKYRARGVAGLVDRRVGGNRAKLTKAQVEELKERRTFGGLSTRGMGSDIRAPHPTTGSWPYAALDIHVHRIGSSLVTKLTWPQSGKNLARKLLSLRAAPTTVIRMVDGQHSAGLFHARQPIPMACTPVPICDLCAAGS